MASHNVGMISPAQSNSTCRHSSSQHAQAKAPMHVVNNLPEHPGRIYPTRSFVAAAVGERRDGSTGSPLPCHTDQSAFTLTARIYNFHSPAWGSVCYSWPHSLLSNSHFCSGLSFSPSAAQSAPARSITLLEENSSPGEHCCPIPFAENWG